VQYLVDGEVIDAGTHPGQGLVTVTAEAEEGYVLAEGATTEWSHEFSTDGEDPSEGEPTEPPQEAGTPGDDLPDTEAAVGVYAALAAALLRSEERRVGGEVIDAGTHPGQGLVTVTAEAEEGYVLAEGATTEWSHEFSTDGEDPSEEEPTDPPQEPGTPGDDLPDTGTDIGIYAALAAVLLVAGVSTALTVRRRRV